MLVIQEELSLEHWKLQNKEIKPNLHKEASSNAKSGLCLPAKSGLCLPANIHYQQWKITNPFNQKGKDYPSPTIQCVQLLDLRQAATLGFQYIH